MTLFEQEVANRLATAKTNTDLNVASQTFVELSFAVKYSYNFFWAGRPIIQYPQDMIAMQEIVWATRPDLIIETGIAHGGSLLLSASLLAMLDYCDAAEAGEMLNPQKPCRRVLGIDVDIRPHNLSAIKAHPFANRIDMLQGSSIDPEIISQVRAKAKSAERVMVCLDSNHTHSHVFEELESYADLVTPGCYCVVFDTLIEDLPAKMSANRPWGPGDNPKTAIDHWLPKNTDFEIDTAIDAKLKISVASNGYIRRKR